MEDIKALLDEDEKISWVGKPEENALTKKYLESKHSFQILFSTIIPSIFIITFSSLSYSDSTSFFAMQLFLGIGLPMLAILILLFFSLFLPEYKKRFIKDVIYCITSKRIMIYSLLYEPVSVRLIKLFDYFNVDLSVMEMKGNVAYVSIDKIYKVEAEKVQKHEDITFHAQKGDDMAHLIFAQLKEKDEIIQILIKEHSFQQDISNKKQVRYVRSNEK